MSIKEALEIANARFIDAGIDNYFYETRELLSFVLKKSKEWIMSNLEYIMQDTDYVLFLELIKDRIDGKPFQYILKEQYFMGFKFFVNNNVLIPRADTEVLVCQVIGLAKDKENIKILDMCTGSGCIAVSLAKKLNNAKIYGADISKEALTVAQKNSIINETNIIFYQSNLFDSIPREKFDIIVSNPPYIRSDEMDKLSKDVLMEPHIALCGGEDGLKFYREISREAREYLTGDGIIAFEIGYNQADEVIDILNEFNYKKIQLIKDYADNNRVITAYR